ncbi:hypothetical protein N7493_000612 [Penicillium malachiteum]|uniref:Acyltransferase 3 domain-containing protein n=1 Tax=Penicillium malachiteum TaxID=1324776 RepID=A0AAD6N1L4_9EURO|nr:hypothetical protein N7493_000612 [Penicillium malachiteum]
MVLLFFVISGYAVSISIIRLREAAPMHFYWKLTSSVLRRGFQLYIPVLVTCVLSYVALFTGLTDWNPGNVTEGCPKAEPWSALGAHLSCLTMIFLTTLDLTGSLQATGYDFHLWTISYELQCSLSIYLVILGLAPAKPRLRLMAIACLATFMWFGSPIISAFLAGLIFAELDISKQESSNASTSVDKRYQTRLSAACLNLLPGLLLGIGIFLICLPQDPNSPPEFWFQSQLALPFYVDPQIRIRAWHAIGAILVVGALRHLPLVRAPLESKLAPFLGTISFSIYLLHPIFIMILRNRILEGVCHRLWGTDFWQTRQDESAWHVFSWPGSLQDLSWGRYWFWGRVIWPGLLIGDQLRGRIRWRRFFVGAKQPRGVFYIPCMTLRPTSPF